MARHPLPHGTAGRYMEVSVAPRIILYWPWSTCGSLGSLVVQDMTALKRKHGDSDVDTARHGGIPSRVAGQGGEGMGAVRDRRRIPEDGVGRALYLSAKVDAV